MFQSLSGNLQGRPRTAWPVRVLTGLLWAALAACIVFWGLRLGATRALPSAAVPALRLPEPADPLAVARVLGAGAGASEASATADSGRLVLTGVVASRSGGGSALIAVDGAPPRSFRVGSRVQGDLWLQSVQARQARLGPDPGGASTLLLELPALPQP
ncbi:MAG: type II secretion system protein N [Ramlibacter sp.]|jgi:general secretion pathway protein C